MSRARPVAVSGGGAYPFARGRFAYYQRRSRGGSRSYKKIPSTREIVYKGFNRTKGWYGRFGPSSFGPPELKFHDLNTGNVFINQGSRNNQRIFESLNLIAGGSTESTRIGRRCTLRYAEIKFRFGDLAANVRTARTKLIRLVILIDHQTNGSAVTVADYLADTSPATSLTDVLRFRNLEVGKRFTVLLDTVITMQPRVAFSSTGDPVYSGDLLTERYFKFTTKLNCPLEWSGNTGAISELCCNNLAVLMLENENQATSGSGGTEGGVEVHMLSRVRFSDN
jgi:hypothetical protein